MFEGKYCKIINRFTGKTIVSGKIVNCKETPIKCIAFDNKYFFNISKKILYKFIFCDYCDEVKFDNIKYEDKIILWKEVYSNKKSLIYREYDITELDEEIKDLVYAINNIPIKTTGSCSGHGKLYAWVDICFNNFNQLRGFIDILNIKDFRNKFTLEISYGIINDDKNSVIMKLKTNKIGTEAYNDIKELTEYINLLT